MLDLKHVSKEKNLLNTTNYVGKDIQQHFIGGLVIRLYLQFENDTISNIIPKAYQSNKDIKQNIIDYSNLNSI